MLGHHQGYRTLAAQHAGAARAARLRPPGLARPSPSADIRVLVPAPVVVQLLHHRRAPGGDGGGGDGGGGRQEVQLLKIFARLRRADGCARLRRAWAVVP